MTNTSGMGCCNTVNQYSTNSFGFGIGNYSFVLVLFILLVICGTAYIF